MVPSLNVAVTVTVLALVKAPAPVAPFLTNVPMKMACGSIVRPWVAEMTTGVVVGGVPEMAKLKVVRC